MSITSKQKQYLKGLGHGIKPVIQVGKEGISEKVLSSISKALDDHELIKVTILENSDLDRKEASQIISENTNSELVQVLGRKFLLYKKNKENPKITLPS
ncbi:MAG TPA: ribosome assembly RNA-binding protein YhbY [Chitinispirillaceae bacterium]|jgi:RNA-binding protein|nr:ribosome assembly RNA-binding protein YhbY [Chitinispirillaceae bacterium]